jgi:tRNA pseudouridine38-40 synthase
MSGTAVKRDHNDQELFTEQPKKKGKLEDETSSVLLNSRASRENRGKKLRTGSGRRRGTRPENESPAEDGEKKARLPKRAIALLIGYSGTGYYGMQ